MYKNRIKSWGITKYLKKEEAEKLAKAEGAERDRAQRSIIRRKARESTKGKLHNEKSTGSDEEPHPELPQTTTPLNVRPPLDNSHVSQFTSSNIVAEPSPIQTETPRPWEPPPSLPRRPTLDGSMPAPVKDLLVALRRWTHEAVISGHWERSASTQHEKARHVSRQLASDLQAGLKYMEQGKVEMVWVHWRSAIRRFENPDLFKTWYHETPIRLLFEIARIKESGHPQFAAQLLTNTGVWATTRLEPNDVRHALYSTYGLLEVDKIRDVYEQAARFMLDGLASRLEKDDPLLFEIRLNRALDMSYFDETVDLSEWLPPLEEVDETMGTKNSFCVYYLLLQAYQLVALGEINAADKKASEARRRIDSLPSGGIDQYKLGMAYRRLGRMQYKRQHWQDAKRSFNQAWKNLKTGKHADGLMIEVLQCQLTLALQTDDVADVDIYRDNLAKLEHKIQAQEQQEMQEEVARGGALDHYTVNGHMGMTSEPVVNGADVPSITVDSPAPFENGRLVRVPTLTEGK
jgi:tetratricopeptide (TPR) repeat protein